MDDHLEAPGAVSGGSADPCSDCSDKDDSEYLCPICLQPVTHQSYVEPCYHEYCYLCICQWIEFRPHCPLCNGKAQSVVQQLKSGKIVKTAVASEPGKRVEAHSRRLRQQVRVYGRPEDSQKDSEQGHRKRMAVYSRSLRRAAFLSETSTRTRVSKSPELVRQAIVSGRCRAWVQRDIAVILDTSDTTILEELVVSIIKDSGTLDNQVVGPLIEPVLGLHTEIFVDELAAFMDSTLPMAMYDRYIAYDTANPE
ncbi:hypothetical protein EC988_001673 [Linderina pennispora]|nr:hypothetical protein EC988_001673 [Linderina pennispora]